MCRNPVLDTYKNQTRKGDRVQYWVSTHLRTQPNTFDFRETMPREAHTVCFRVMDGAHSTIIHRFVSFGFVTGIKFPVFTEHE